MWLIQILRDHHSSLVINMRLEFFTHLTLSFVLEMLHAPLAVQCQNHHTLKQYKPPEEVAPNELFVSRNVIRVAVLTLITEIRTVRRGVTNLRPVKQKGWFQSKLLPIILCKIVGTYNYDIKK